MSYETRSCGAKTLRHCSYNITSKGRASYGVMAEPRYVTLGDESDTQNEHFKSHCVLLPVQLPSNEVASHRVLLREPQRLQEGGWIRRNHKESSRRSGGKPHQ